MSYLDHYNFMYLSDTSGQLVNDHMFAVHEILDCFQMCVRNVGTMCYNVPVKCIKILSATSQLLYQAKHTHTDMFATFEDQVDRDTDSDIESEETEVI